MIFDCRADHGHAKNYDIISARTGENLNHLRIFYADDERGIIRRHLIDANGQLYMVWEHSQQVVAWTEEPRAIRIVRKAST